MPFHSVVRLTAFGFLALPLSSKAGSAVEQISRFAEAYVKSGEVPGIIVGISRAGAAPIVIVRGVSDIPAGAPMDPANQQRIGSITKSFTVTRILQLADEGRLGLDDPIGKYVPGLRNGGATLRELADMTSGIFNYTEDTPFVLDFAFHRTKPWTDKKLVDVANRHEPYFPPGRHWHYSNTNTILLGMVVERVTGHPLGAEITQHIIRPLHLDHTLYPAGIFLPRPFSHGYATLDAGEGRIDVTEVSPSGFSGAGAMISTMGDLFRWGRALARGSLLSRRSQLARLQTIDSSRGVGPYYDSYGLALGRIDGWLGHTGDLFGYQSLVMHNLVADETVVILVNASNPDHVPTDLFRAMAPLLPRAVPVRAPLLRVSGPRHRATTAGSITLRGRASSDAGILLVESSSAGAPGRLAKGTRTWSSRVALRPGGNIVTLRAIDGLGRRSRPTRIIIDRN